MGATNVSTTQNSQDYEMEVEQIIIDVFERSEMGGSSRNRKAWWEGIGWETAKINFGGSLET